MPDAEPRIEAIRSGGPNKPYEALGRAYVPITDDRPFVERGLASWYGRKFHGRRTASGEPFDMYAMTAAHPTLPIPSYARVRNPANGREVVVRINDRGPFHRGRIVDLSYTAALRLDVLRGVAPVELARITRRRDPQWRVAARRSRHAGGPADRRALTRDPEASEVSMAGKAVKAGAAPSSKALSLHIGLNAVSGAAYAGWTGPLVACEFDAHDMAAIARQRGMKASVLLTKKATRAATLSGLRAAARALRPGDLFFLSYSGHGGQVPDVTGDEADRKDETWCLHDGQLIDDELYLELGRLRRRCAHPRRLRQLPQRHRHARRAAERRHPARTGAPG